MKWHHSLYWRIAVGFVACLALMLAVQALLFVWVIARSGSTVPNQPPDRVAQTIAADATQALERDPSLDVERYLRQEYSRDAQPFFVIFADGRTMEVGSTFPSPTIEEARHRLAQLQERRLLRPSGDRFPPGPFFGPRGRGRTDTPDRNDGPGPGGPAPPGRGNEFGRPDLGERGGPPGRRPGFRFGRPAAIFAGDRVLALVVVPPRPPFTFLFSRYAPALGTVALVTLVVGAALATAVIFGAARKRLRAVEDAARRLGSGELDARAPAGGHDEVSAVARAFNTMADELSARAAALAASDRARRQLLADVSHELTTPVTVMRGYLETLTMPELGLDEATRARYLGILGDETARLERIIGDLLDLARLEGGGGAIVIEDVSVRPLFDRVEARHERAAAAAGVRFTTSIEGGAAIVRGDRDRLEQALQNLAANALRHAPSGSTIDLQARPLADGVAISVTDHGAGIASEHLPHLFDRFYKADPSRAVRQGNGGGSGLGLSIVKAIVERHGGRVTVQSEPGRTVFALEMTR